MKESLFAILGDRIDDARVLDLFAGSGALGFEALSRGARFATFVESDRKRAEHLRATAGALAVGDRCEVVAAPAERAVTRLSDVYDVVFADPPYAHGFPARALAVLRERALLGDDSVVVYEHSARTTPDTPGFVATRGERYGDVALAFLRPEAAA